MKKKDYNIVFSGLKLGSHSFEYEIDDSFLDILFDYHELPGLQAHVDVELTKQNTMLELNFSLKGELPVTCDLSNKPFVQPIENTFTLVVKFGEEYNDDDDVILVLPHGDYEINIAHYIYELIVLSIPLKFIHPDIEEGDLDDETRELLEKYMPRADDDDNEEEDSEEDEEDDEDEDIDPRWSKLKDLLN
ncbi:YceD family protein [Phaeocystidibacter marisrubri]|uniref:DUF177 domain-containing protein n=1 Tax=Phaeocystidibacter marisrubri TaxID=1577780 RepID=A0A6L3ZH87_9FLAO|nr:DUF177 domain-containing protein [Phaeocystidibacter marisrubri]KAB2816329.1 DUF177 domain-containing protein [Phaeocystidibacter marisrubri]GGH68481.1 DNA-binding protein [Phaeocystidibacter marisrubri]